MLAFRWTHSINSGGMESKYTFAISPRWLEDGWNGKKMFGEYTYKAN